MVERPSDVDNSLILGIFSLGGSTAGVKFRYNSETSVSLWQKHNTLTNIHLAELSQHEIMYTYLKGDLRDGNTRLTGLPAHNNGRHSTVVASFLPTNSNNPSTIFYKLSFKNVILSLQIGTSTLLE